MAIFYGTGAAEGIPDPFCSCYLCEYARAHGGKDLRSRSMFRLDESMALDMGPDSFLQGNRYGDFKKLKHVLITHTHDDHFSPMMMSVRKMATVRETKTLHYYFTDRAFDMVEEMRSNPAFLKGALQKMEEDGIIACHKLRFYETAEIGGKQVTPLRGHHFGNFDDQCANYLIRLADGTTLYYGTDTGKYEAETLDYLAGVHIDILISECTWGNVEDRYPDPGHLSFTTALETIGKLRAMGTLGDYSRIYLTHINHCHTAHHAELQRLWDSAGLPNPVTVAWDGLEIEL